MYNLSEEQEIARAVAAKAFVDPNFKGDEGFVRAGQAYTNTMTKRAVRYLKEIEQKIDLLSNQEVADLLKVLIAGGLVIETEEELEYWIALLEQIALKRVFNAMALLANDENASITDAKGLIAVFQSIQALHMRRQPKNRNSEEFNAWQKMQKNLQRAGKILKQRSQKSKNQAGLRRRKSGSKKESNSNDDSTKDRLIGKMIDAGVPPYGPYWNDVLASFEAATDKADFVNSWVVDEKRRDEETGNKKEQNKKEKPKNEKEDKKPEKSDQQIIEELRMGRQQQNEEKINKEFQNPSNVKAAKDVANKKLDRTGEALTSKDIAEIKIKMIGGR